MAAYDDILEGMQLLSSAEVRRLASPNASCVPLSAEDTAAMAALGWWYDAKTDEWVHSTI